MSQRPPHCRRRHRYEEEINAGSEWTDQNRTLITASEDGFVRRWDVEVRGWV